MYNTLQKLKLSILFWHYIMQQGIGEMELGPRAINDMSDRAYHQIYLHLD